MRLSTLVLAIGMALGAQAQAAETQPHADHSALPSGQAKEATVTGEANQHDKQKTQNPFFYQSRLPFQAPPFNLIKESDYAPAIEAGIKQKREEVEKIANNPAKPNFKNTFVALEQAGSLLTRVMSVFGAMTSANTSDALQKLDEETSPKLAALNDDIMLNGKLFARIKAIYQDRDALKLDPESRRLVEVTYKNFELAGANLSDADKAKLKALNQEAATLSTQFTNKLLAASKNGALAITDPAKLDGLSEGGCGGPGGRRTQAGETVAAGAAKHHATAVAAEPERSRYPPSAVRRLLDACGEGRRQRYPPDHFPSGQGARRTGQAAGLSELRRLETAKPDGQDTGCRAELYAQHRTGGHRARRA